MTLTEFLTARLDEDEATARRFLEPISGEESGDAFSTLVYGRFYLAQFNPARVLREVAAKRKLLDLCAIARRVGPGTALASNVERALAAVYSDHPDYRQDWA